MLGFEENFILEFPEESWIIRLQLLVMFLLSLLLLITYLTFHGSSTAAAADHKRNSSSVAAGDCTSTKQHWKRKEVSNRSSCNLSGINCSLDNKVTKDQATSRGHLATSSTRRKLINRKEIEEEDIDEIEESSAMLVKQPTIMQFCLNPCYFLEQFLKPFLKCLGFESTYHDA